MSTYLPKHDPLYSSHDKDVQIYFSIKKLVNLHIIFHKHVPVNAPAFQKHVSGHTET